MKKRIIAMLLAASMVMSGSMTAFASETHDADGDEHGTTEEALIGDEGEFADEGNNVTGSTQFYLNIDKDANHTDDTVTVKDVEISKSYDVDVCHYDIEYTTQLESHIRATVPLYVCMYAYGGTGEVVTPDEDAYAIENESTYTDKKWVSRITPYYAVTPILSYDGFTASETFEKATARYIDVNISYLANKYGTTDKETLKQDLLDDDEFTRDLYEQYISDFKNKEYNGKVHDEDFESGLYGIYCYNDKYTLIPLSECSRHSDNDNSDNNAGCYYIKGDDVTHAKTYTGYVFTPEDENFSEEFAYYGSTYGYDVGYAANNKALALNVPTVRTEASWTLEPMSTGTLQARQLSMSVNGLDLSDVNNANSFGEAHTLDITGLKWVVPAFEAEEKSSDSAYYDDEGFDKVTPDVLKTPGKLNLPIQAAIAGGNLNEEGCAPVVKVTYMLSPAYNLIDREYTYIGRWSDES